MAKHKVSKYKVRSYPPDPDAPILIDGVFNSGGKKKETPAEKRVRKKDAIRQERIRGAGDSANRWLDSHPEWFADFSERAMKFVESKEMIDVEEIGRAMRDGHFEEHGKSMIDIEREWRGYAVKRLVSLHPHSAPYADVQE